VSDKIIRLPDDETDGDEGWERATDEPDPEKRRGSQV